MILPLDLVKAKIPELDVPRQISQRLTLLIVDGLHFVRSVEVHEVRPNVVLAAHFLVSVGVVV